MKNYLQLRLFQQVSCYEDIKNMGMVISYHSNSRGIYGHDYYITLNKKILDYITMSDLHNIIENNFHGYYGGHSDIKLLTDSIYIHYDAWND